MKLEEFPETIVPIMKKAIKAYTELSQEYRKKAQKRMFMDLCSKSAQTHIFSLLKMTN